MNAENFYHTVCSIKDKELLRKLSVITEFKSLQKGEIIVRDGEIRNEIRLLESGIARGYFLNTDGKDVTDCFMYRRGEGIMSYCQLELDVPSPMTIEMLEDGSYYCLPISGILELLRYYPEIIVYYNHLLTISLNTHWKLQQVLNQCTATQRYQWFLTFPELAIFLPKMNCNITEIIVAIV